MGDPKKNEEEPFLLTILPFAGLTALLVLAVVWRVLPGPEARSAPDPADIAIARWNNAPERTIEIEPGRDFSKGPVDAPVTLVEFSDFECPFCRTASAGVHDVLEKYEGKVRLVFKNFPLDQACNEAMDQPLHVLACDAAALARCAGEQDPSYFWQAHDALFALSSLSVDGLEGVVGKIDGVDPDALSTCRASDSTREAIQGHIAEGRALGVSGTPIFFANGRRVSDYRTLDALVAHILSTL